MKKVLTTVMGGLLVLGLVAAVTEKKSSQSVEIKAPAAEVWKVLIDVNHWPDQNPAVKSAKLVSGDGEKVGSVIEFYPVIGKMKPMKVTLTIAGSEKNRKLEYTAKVTGGVITVMGFELKEADGTTTLINYEHAKGPAVMLISQEDMDNEHRQWVESVKKRVEAPPK